MSHVPMTRPEELLATCDHAFGAVSFLALKDGRILLTNGSQFATSADGGLTWSEPGQGVDEQGQPLEGGNPSLVSLSDGAIGMATRRTRPGSASLYDSEMVFRTSVDEGRTWSPLTVMNPPLLRAHGPRDTMIRTASGRILLPVYFGIGQGSFRLENAPVAGGYLDGNFVSTDAHFFDPHFSASYVLYSDDEGKTWQSNRDGEIFVIPEPGGPVEEANEPSIVEVTPGKLLMILRTGLGRYFQCHSLDNGETWSRPVPTQLAGTQAPAQVRRFPQTGHLLVVFTQQSEQEIKRGLIRTRLSAAISRNHGLVWEHFQNIESLHEETHVEPGPIYPVRPAGTYGAVGGATEGEAAYVQPLPPGYGMWSYPSVFVAQERVLISYNYYRPDAKTGGMIRGHRLKVLPFRWFYGGADPHTENEALKRFGAGIYA